MQDISEICNLNEDILKLYYDFRQNPNFQIYKLLLGTEAFNKAQKMFNCTNPPVFDDEWASKWTE